ncbi:hypothetical protein J2128_002526 [Methanomicrobium sp. W14]|uniref:hypothetical protein n=1 Tax=Methanomicrobium sp. W14 TaxID=2817839 RepID=UPI001AE9AF95|nr:hypothetical protein [Methanomicrobium sp. W14]MBP2134555.1 hypothetical protein [Methanomicrobium sp. W14]
MVSVSDYIKLSADEEVIKEYRGFDMKKPQRATLNMAVTSKRLIIYAMTKTALKMNRPSLTQEMKTGDVRGLEVYEKSSCMILPAILGTLIFLAGLYGLYKPTAPFFYDLFIQLGNPLYGGAAVTLIGLIIFIISFAAGGKDAVIIIRGKNENQNCGVFSDTKTVIKWGSEAQKMLCEMGSVILDIQENAEIIKNKIENKETYEYETGEDSTKNNGEYSGFQDDKETEYSESMDFLDTPDYSSKTDELEEEQSKRDDYLF